MKQGDSSGSRNAETVVVVVVIVVVVVVVVVTLMVASSLAEAITEKRGWNITRVMGALWPVRVYRSGGLGIHSEGDLRSDLPPAPPALPLRSSASASAILDSSSMTFFCRRITEIHFFSSRPLYFFSTSPSCKNGRMVSGRCGWRD